MPLHEKLKKGDKLLNKTEMKMKDEEEIRDNITQTEIKQEASLFKKQKRSEMSSLHENQKKVDDHSVEHELLKKIEQEMKDDDQGKRDNVLLKETKEENEERILFEGEKRSEMSSLHEKLKGGDHSVDHKLLKKIKQEKKGDHQEERDNVLLKDIKEEKEIKQETKDDHQEESDKILLKEIKQETKDDHQEERDKVPLKEIKKEKEIKQETKDDLQQERDNVLLKEVKEEKEADQRLFKKQKRDDDDEDDQKVDYGSFDEVLSMASYKEKLKKVDDGSFDELVKKIELQTKDKERRENLLTETVLQKFRSRCALNADKDRQEIKLKASERAAETFKHYLLEKVQATSEPVLVIEKRLTNSDLSDDTDQSSLSIPKAMIIDHHFLSEQEIQKIDKDEGELMVTLVEIDNRIAVETNLKLKNLGTDYVLTQGQKWNEVKRRNEERFRRADGVNAVVQLWSFRNNSSLYFALFVVRDEP